MCAHASALTVDYQIVEFECSARPREWHYSETIPGDIIFRVTVLSENYSYSWHQQLKKKGLWEGVVQEPLRRALFCVFLCSEVIFSCKSHRNFFSEIAPPMQAFSGKPPRANPKTQVC